MDVEAPAPFHQVGRSSLGLSKPLWGSPRLQGADLGFLTYVPDVGGHTHMLGSFHRTSQVRATFLLQEPRKGGGVQGVIARSSGNNL